MLPMPEPEAEAPTETEVTLAHPEELRTVEVMDFYLRGIGKPDAFYLLGLYDSASEAAYSSKSTLNSPKKMHRGNWGENACGSLPIGRGALFGRGRAFGELDDPKVATRSSRGVRTSWARRRFLKNSRDQFLI